jgi:hypothetical protein
MAWIKTIPFPEADERLQKAIADARALYLRRDDGAGPAAAARTARDDRDDGLGHEQVHVLNRVPRRVSA